MTDTTDKARLPKQQVLDAHPTAYAERDIDDYWHIWVPGIRGAISGGQKDVRSAAAAWKLASERLPAPPKD